MSTSLSQSALIVIVPESSLPNPSEFVGASPWIGKVIKCVYTPPNFSSIGGYNLVSNNPISDVSLLANPPSDNFIATWVGVVESPPKPINTLSSWVCILCLSGIDAIPPIGVNSLPGLTESL